MVLLLSRGLLFIVLLSRQFDVDFFVVKGSFLSLLIAVVDILVVSEFVVDFVVVKGVCCLYCCRQWSLLLISLLSREFVVGTVVFKEVSF